MKWTIGKKIGAGFVVPLAVLVVIGLLSYWSITKFIETARWVAHTHKVLETLKSTVAHMTDAETGQRGYLLTGEEPFLEPYTSALTRVEADISQLRKLTQDNPNQQRRLDVLERLVSEKLGDLKNTIELRKKNKIESALAIVRTGGKRAMDDLRRLASEMDSEEIELLKQRSENADSTAQTAIQGIVLGTLFAFVLVAVVGFLISRGITTEVLSQVTVLSSSCSEIVAAITQQAAGTAEEATAVQETSTTVDEIKQTAQVSAQKARVVSETAQKAAHISQDGRKALEETIKGAQDAKERMGTIAERILHLSEQGQAIGEIITTVNDLAEQSNLLAVNAAIEAAKAGEAGKGFAVVAAEVKGLAEQSKQATAQIRTILNEIQRATQAAVMAAEQGVKTSEASVVVAAKAGDAIRLLTDSQAESAQSAQQILASVQQQAAGMDQIALAMKNVQQSSTQNMAATKQVEQTAHDLKALAQRLTSLVVASADERRR